MYDISKTTMAEDLERMNKESNQQMLKHFLICGAVGAVLALIIFL